MQPDGGYIHVHASDKTVELGRISRRLCLEAALGAKSSGSFLIDGVRVPNPWLIVAASSQTPVEASEGCRP